MKPSLLYLSLIVILLGLATAVVAQAPAISVRNLMTVNEFNAAGLNKLSPEELTALDRWFVRTLTDFGQRAAATSSSSAVTGTYPIEASVNDETFVINSEVFKARTYCFNVEKGDRVKFVEGNALGACASAKFVNMRTGNVCEVWCE